MDQDRVVYTERSRWPVWVQLIIWGALAAGMWGALKSGDASALVLLGLPVLGGLLMYFLGGLTVIVRRQSLTVALGRGWPFRKHVAYDRIQRIEPVEYHPLREFGGWGIRFGAGKKRAWTASGNQAVVLHLDDGTRLYVGSNDAKRLASRIRAAAGGRFDSEADARASGARP